MLKIGNTVTPSPEQWTAVIQGARSPLNSWERSDSDIIERATECPSGETKHETVFLLGDNDKNLLQKLCVAGESHRKYLRMLPVMTTIKAPTYWWAEMDTYKVATVRNSCSFMHKGTEEPFTPNDFSIDNLEIRDALLLQRKESWCDIEDYFGDDRETERLCWLWNEVIDALNNMRMRYNTSKDEKIFREIRNLLPSGYLVRATWSANYETLLNIYNQRKSHRLPEWKAFCKWIETLPNFREICLCDHT